MSTQTTTPIIEGISIEKSFQSGEVRTTVLRGINLTVHSGEFIAIMGKSGAGKSTLLYQLSALDRPTVGDVRIEGVSVNTLSEYELAKFRLFSLGYIFQDYALIAELTALENVMLPLLMRNIDWRIALETAEATLASVELAHKFDNLPSQLSGGEQQRVAIARAIAGKPKIIFADEPTANLDSNSGRTVIKLLEALHAAGQTIVMVTHEEEYAQNCDRIIYLEDGRIVSDASAQRPSTQPIRTGGYPNQVSAIIRRNKPISF